MDAFIPTKEELEEIIQRAVKQTVRQTLPEAINKATRKEWLTTDDVMGMLQCSRRHVQHLRDSGQLKYYQNGRKIHYWINDVEEYINRGKVANK